MGAFTTYGRKLLVDGLFIAPASIGNTYVALTSVIPGTADDSSRLVEPIGGAYARVSYLFASGWEVGQPGEAFNTRNIAFATPTGNWGTMRGWALMSAATLGHVIAAGQLQQATAVKTGMTVNIAIHGIRVALR